jgi:hypothetical protein
VNNTPTETVKESTQRTTASGVVIRNVTRAGVGVGIVGGVKPSNREKTD